MALASRLRCPFQTSLLTVRRCVSQAPGAHSGNDTIKEKPASVAQSTTDSSTSQGNKSTGSKPVSFEIAHLGDWGGKDPEKFIPISRRLLIRRLIEDSNLLSEAQCSKLEQFSLALNQAIALQMVHHLEDMKVRTRSYCFILHVVLGSLAVTPPAYIP